MSAPLNIDMNAVTRLTKAGRLLEATTLLQRALSGSRNRGRPLDISDAADQTGGSDDPPMIDMAPPSVPGAPWASSGSTPPASQHSAQSSLIPPTPSFMRSPLDRGGRPSTWSERLPAGLASARDTLPKGARFEVHGVSNKAGSMRYKVYVPSAYVGRPLPLVVMLHGCTQTPDDFAAGTQMNEVAEEFLCLVAYPEQTKAANASKCWNWFRPGDQLRDRGEPSLIADVTRQVMRDYAVDPDRVFIAGLSAGGAAAAIMGHEYPDLYKAICVHSGLACGSAKDVSSAFAAMRTGGSKKANRHSSSKSPVPAIVFHGSADNTVNPSNADQVVHQSRSDVSTSAVKSSGRSAGGVDFTRTVEKDEAGKVIAEQWILHGAGHAWSGGSKIGSYTDPRGPDASREMMRFFVEVTGAQSPV
jgi:poly(hydroxyalkanoate) depolymerase family esterase